MRPGNARLCGPTPEGMQFKVGAACLAAGSCCRLILHGIKAALDASAGRCPRAPHSIPQLCDATDTSSADHIALECNVPAKLDGPTCPPWVEPGSGGSGTGAAVSFSNGQQPQ